jgi:two-component system CheB/CheR fusion protein
MPLVSEPNTLELLKERILPQLFVEDRQVAVRAWAPRCASGEDAYTLAMLLAAHVDEHRLGSDLRVIASDEDSDTLNRARAGVYPHSVHEEFSAAGLELYFHPEDGAFRVIKRVRDCVLFSAHRLRVDPPFPRLDLVLGSHLFGDLTSDEQAELLQTLHFALAPQGFLVLAPRRLPEGLEPLFSAFDRDRGIFRRRDEPTAPPLARHFVGPRQVSSGSSPPSARRTSDRPGLGGALERLVLQGYTPPCVVVDDDHKIVYSLGKVSRFFQPPQGVPTADLLLMAKPQLREPLRALLRAPLKGDQPLRFGGIQLEEQGSLLEYAIDVYALENPNGGAGLRAFIFTESVEPRRGQAPPPSNRTGRASSPAIALEPEEKSRVAREELVSFNEELQSLNEELEASNAELQASQEQLQSVNEELETVNGELRLNVAELDRVNSDLHNLMENTQIAALFLDRELRIRIFTPAAQDLFRFIAADRGRPLADIAPRFRYPELRAELLHTLRTRTVREAQVEAPPRWYLMRIMPYLTAVGEVDGLVLTFSDVTDLKLADLEVQRLGAELEKQLAWLKTLVDVVPVGIGFHEMNSDAVRLNRSASQLVDTREGKQAAGSGLSFAWQLNEAPSAAKLELWGAMTSPHAVSGVEIQLEQVMDEPRQVLVHAAPLYNAEGAPYAKVSGVLDITEIKRERERALVREKQQAIVADLGLRALDARDLDVFLVESLKLICSGADAELCDLTRLEDEGASLELVGQWPFAAPEDASERIAVGESSMRALEQREPIVLSSQQAFPADWPERLRRDGVMVGARIGLHAERFGHPFGILGVYRRTPRDFSNQELFFLRAIAGVLTSAVQRKLIEQVRFRETQAAAQRESERQIQRNERLASLGTFATGIAHELNNPLSNIVLSADYAAKTPDGNRRTKMLETIHENALRCGRIVDSVLRFARDEATEKWINDLNPIVRHAGAHVLSYVGPHKLSITFELVEPSPRLNCNPTEIEQVFVNLLKNAAQAHPQQCNVRIHSEIDGQEVCISVTDDGPGIKSSDFERIFDPFYSTQRAQGGTGLGLSISNRILSTHGGSIRAIGTKGGGARFELRLPLAQAPGGYPA